MFLQTNITLQQLLHDPYFSDAVVLTGNNYLLHPIKNVHLLNNASIGLPLKMNSLIITNDVNKLSNIMLQSLIDQGILGIIIKQQTLSDELLQIAEKHKLPIIMTPISITEIIHYVHSLLINRHNLALQSLHEFSRNLEKTILKSSELKDILELLAQYSEHDVLYYSFVEDSMVIPSSNEQEKIDSLHHFINAVDANMSSARKLTLLKLTDNQLAISHPLSCLGQVIAYIGLLLPDGQSTSALQDYFKLLLENACKTAEQLLLRKLLLDEREMEGPSKLIREILFGDIQYEDQVLAQIGLPEIKNGKYLFVAGLIVLERPEHLSEHQAVKSLNQDIMMLLRSLLSTHGIYNLLLLDNNVIHLLCIRESFASTSSQWTKIKHALQKVIALLQKSNPDRPSNALLIQAGFGHMKNHLKDASQSYKEALDVISISKHLPQSGASFFYEDIGIYQLFKSIGRKDQLVSFVSYHLGGLLAHDKQNQSQLLLTLKHFLTYMGSKQETAASLFIHRQTLYQRLEKIEELLGKNYLEVERRLCLEVAIHAYTLIKDDLDHSTATF